MTVDVRDTEFARALDRDRALLQGTAYLLLDDRRAAQDLLDATLADCFVQRVEPAALRSAAVRSLAREDARPPLLPWTHPETFELLDGSPRIATAGIIGDLGRLPQDQRTTVVLRLFTQLSSAGIADLLARPLDEVLELARQARTALAADHPERRTDEGLTAELRAAIPYDWQVSRGSHTDLVNGRRLIRRRQLRAGSLATAVVLALVLLVSQLWPHPPFTPAALPPAVSTSAVPRATCDPSGVTCRTALLQDWRAEVTEIANSHLDPERKHAFGFDLSVDRENPTFWSGRGGALTLELFRVDREVTQVDVQIASSREFAPACGATTHTTCVTMRFMDGNSYTMSDTRPSQGVEVQYSPDGKQVITAIAHNTRPGRTGGGEAQPITRGDLVDLVQDQRLDLPNL